MNFKKKPRFTADPGFTLLPFVFPFSVKSDIPYLEDIIICIIYATIYGDDAGIFDYLQEVEDYMTENSYPPLIIDLAINGAMEFTKINYDIIGQLVKSHSEDIMSSLECTAESYANSTIVLFTLPTGRA